MLAARDTAGARYAAAVAEFRAAYVDLFAMDLALKNRNVGIGDGINTPRTFSGEFREIPVGARHPDYAPQARGGMDYAVGDQEQTYLNALKAG